MDVKGFLPVVQFVYICAGMQGFELGIHFLGKSLQTGQALQALTFVRADRHAQDARGPWVGRFDSALCVKHHDPGREVVQDGLQFASGLVKVAQAAFSAGAGIGQLLGHLGK